jgi:uncharacterized membrane protein YdjX (TVP38/TMEM64 family)
MTARVVAAALLLLAIAAVAVAGLPLASWIAAAATWAQRHREAAAALFVVIYVLAAVLLVPGAILTLAAGFLFGLPFGVALTSAGSTLGAAAAFVVGRFAARDWVAQRVATWPRFRALVAATRTDGFRLVLLARLSPFIPYNVLNYALSVTEVRFFDYLLATWIGMLPAIVLYVYAGSLAKNLAELTSAGAPSWAVDSLLAFGFVATVALTWLIARRATRVLQRLTAESPQSPPGGAP